MQTPLGDEVMRVINSGQGISNIYLDAMVHTKFGDVGVLRVLNHDILRQYNLQYSDESSIVVVIPAGAMAYRVTPSRNELEITLSNSPISQFGSLGLSKQYTGSQRYRAVLKNANDPILEASAREYLDEFTMDIQDIKVVEFQLFDVVMEQFAMRSCGGTYRRTSVGDLVKSLLLGETNLIDTEDAYKPRGVDMIEPIDTTIREHIVIPHGTMTYDAPGYIHKHQGGIYSSGLSYYYQDHYWYVYPTFDYKQFNTASRQLMIMQVPENKFPSLEHTYMVDGSVVTIVATGETSLTDTSDSDKLITGNGVRYSDASKMFEDGVEILDNRAVVSRAKVNNEYASSLQKTDLNNVVMSDETITANTMFQSSKLAGKEGVHLQLVWQNSDPSLIRPGMQAKVLYVKDGEVIQLQTVVVGVQVATRFEGTGSVTGRFSRNTAIYLFGANEANQ